MILLSCESVYVFGELERSSRMEQAGRKQTKVEAESIAIFFSSAGDEG
jgi:hypothetical protein